jgi:hypothetical protein
VLTLLQNPPVCLVHSFPHNIEHCLQWAREIIFEGRFVADADVVNKFLTKGDYVATYVAPLSLFDPSHYCLFLLEFL